MLFWYCEPTRRQRCTSPGRMSIVGRRWPLIARKRVAFLGKQRAEILDHAVGVEHDLRQQHDALARPGDLRHIGEVAFDDDGARHAARHLHVGRAVVMRMIPVGAARMVRRQRDLDVVRLAGRHRAHDVVGDAARAAMRAVEVEVRVVELVRKRGVGGQDIAVGRQVVDEADLERLARLHAQRRAQPALVRAQVEAKAADVAIGVGAAQAGAEHAVRRAPDLGLDQRLVHRRHDRRRGDAELGHVGVRADGLRQGEARRERGGAEDQTAVQHATP